MVAEIVPATIVPLAVIFVTPANAVIFGWGAADKVPLNVPVVIFPETVILARLARLVINPSVPEPRVPLKVPPVMVPVTVNEEEDTLPVTATFCDLTRVKKKSETTARKIIFVLIPTVENLKGSINVCVNR